MLIQIILIAVFLMLLIGILQQRALGRIFKAISIPLLLIATYVVIFPNVTNRVAALAGVGRGADLIIYLCLAVGACLLTVLYIHLKGNELRIARLVQRLAIEKRRVEELTTQVNAKRES